VPRGDQCSVEVFQLILVPSIKRMSFLWPQRERMTFLYCRSRLWFCFLSLGRSVFAWLRAGRAHSEDLFTSIVGEPKFL
jgi:hypothetical protein